MTLSKTDLFRYKGYIPDYADREYPHINMLTHKYTVIRDSGYTLIDFNFVGEIWVANYFIYERLSYRFNID